MSKKLTYEEFIERAIEKHGDKYDYSLVEYVNIGTKVKIICPEHGYFLQTPNGHISGRGCLKCGGKFPLTKETFTEKANQIHGNKYDYSQVEYVNNCTKVKIICPKHGFFMQVPADHLIGKGCIACSRRLPLTTEIFIERAKQIHGDKYDYSQVEYINIGTKVKIICPEHGCFLQTPNSHIGGRGCIKCGGRFPLTKETFTEKAKQVHGNKYDYSLVEYVNIGTKVKIICPKHGEFLQTPSHHLFGKGCFKCMSDKLRICFQHTKQQFIDKAIITHGNKYDYSLVEFINYHIKIKIICNKHGVFLQSPNSHIRGNGCPRCAYSNKSKSADEWLNSLNISNLEKEFVILTTKGLRYIVDGFCKETNIIYEYFGSFWHGNPEKYKSDEINSKTGITFGELYNNTVTRMNNLLKDGYDIIYKWGK